jgi:hypothetical protein
MSELPDIREPHGAFTRIEAWLAERGFFAPETPDSATGSEPVLA